MGTLGFYLVVIVLILTGGFAAIFPARTVAIRQRLGMATSLPSGGWCYATPKRARITGALVAMIGLFGVYLRLSG